MLLSYGDGENRTHLSFLARESRHLGTFAPVIDIGTWNRTKSKRFRVFRATFTPYRLAGTAGVEPAIF
jgi:hypothetical protein